MTPLYTPPPAGPMNRDTAFGPIVGTRATTDGRMLAYGFEDGAGGVRWVDAGEVGDVR